MLGAGVDLRDVQIAARHADPRTTMRYDRAARTSIVIPTTSSPLTWPPARRRLFLPMVGRCLSPSFGFRYTILSCRVMTK
jgi:hypothetical protein